MKSTSVEMEALLAAFQLPTLHPEIPINPVILKKHYDVSSLAKYLLDGKIIRPADIPETASTSEEIISTGLSAWFKRRTKNLRAVHFHIALEVGDGAAGTIDELNMNGGSCYEYQGRPILILHGSANPYYRMDEAAAKLERLCPGLFTSAFSAVERASFRSVELRMPPELWEHIHYRYWDCDASESPTDKEALESLKERFGEDDEVIEHYLPSAVLPIFGGKLCTHEYWRRKRRWGIGPRKLAKVIANHSSAKVRKIASLIASLQKALKRAEKLEASLPSLMHMEAKCITTAATLLFEPESLAYEAIDDIVNEAWNCSEGTDVLGVAELPASAEEISLFFNKLDAAFDVLRLMDKLIPHITTNIETHYE